MDKILKFVFCMIIILSLFLIATKVGGGKPYFHSFYYLISFFTSQVIHNILPYFINL